VPRRRRCRRCCPRRARDWFGDDFVEHFAATREWEWRQWRDAVTDWERKRYFEII
jgi:glutamine synthetase